MSNFISSMETAPYQEALNAATLFRDLTVIPVDSGLINQTYKVIIPANGQKFLLQQINTEVFPDPGKLETNYESIWTHLNDPASGQIPFKIPAPLAFRGHRKLFCDSHKRYWRIFEFIEGAQTIQHTSNSSQAKKVAETFARFTARFEQFDITKLATTIPGFHDLSLRFRQFQESLHSGNYERLQTAASLVNELKKREHYVSLFEVMITSGVFHQRVMHHDAKISNILFDEETGHVICPVDFDTCMPGYFFSDLGDMIRSMACSQDENSTRFSEITVQQDLYKAITAGYNEVMDDFFSEAEKNHIHYAGLLIIYMQALRFLADYLAGDVYYRISYPSQNMDRATNQFILLEKLEDFLREQFSLRV